MSPAELYFLSALQIRFPNKMLTNTSFVSLEVCSRKVGKSENNFFSSRWNEDENFETFWEWRWEQKFSLQDMIFHSDHNL
jgi:hypothetical protein